MAITINGSSNTITGLAAGGLPDDSVNLADLSATGTASSSTFLRGDNSWAAAGGGKILQYKVSKKTDTASSTSSSQVEISSDFRTTLTPTASDSIIVVTAYLYITISDANALSFRIVRNTASDFSGTSTRVLDPTSLASEDDGIATEYVNASGHMSPVVITAYETSANTTARTYSPFWRAGGGTMVMGQWGSGEYLGVSTMTVMEVAA